MPDWAVVLVSAFGGAFFVLLFRVGWEWLRRPRLSIDFEEVNGHKPRILDLFLERERIGGKTPLAKSLRLSVRNAGRRPAMNCEAKMVIFKAETKEPDRPLLHWARRDPMVYKTTDQVYAPIHINKHDEEPLDLFIFRYYPEDADLLPGAKIASFSPRACGFERNVTYHIEVTVYASNAISKPFALKLCWDGTLDGFHKAVQKVEKS